MTYLVIYEHSEDGGWGAHSPDVEGVFAVGQTREEVQARMSEALSAHLSYMCDSGRPIPEPHTDAGRVAAQTRLFGTRKAGPEVRLELSKTEVNSAQLR